MERERDQVSEWLCSKLCGSDSKSKKMSEKAKISAGWNKGLQPKIRPEGSLRGSRGLGEETGRMELSTFQPNKGQREDPEGNN